MRLVIVFLVIILLGLIPFVGNENQSFAQGDKSGWRTIEATGVGVDEKAAIQDALNTAIRQVAGVYLSSEETLKNEDLKTNVYAFSAGYIRKFSNLRIRQDMGSEGLVYASLNAEVATNNLFQSLKEKKVVDGKLDGEEFALHFKNRKALREKAAKHLNTLLEAYPEKYLVGKLLATEDLTKLADEEITLRNTYEVTFDREKYNRLLFYLHSFLERISENSGVVATSKGKNVDGSPLWGKILGDSFASWSPLPLNGKPVRTLITMQYKKDSENPLLKGLPEGHSLVLVFEPALETEEWARWKWYQIPKFYVESKGLDCIIHFQNEDLEEVFQNKMVFGKDLNGLTFFPINKAEQEQKNFSGILISPFFFDAYRFTDGFRFQVRHRFSPDVLKKIKKVNVSLTKPKKE